MAETWETELLAAVTSNSVNLVKSILNREDVKRNGNLGRNKWFYSPSQVVHHNQPSPPARQLTENPLYYAASRGYNDIIKVMVEAGINVNSFIVITSPKRYRTTALHGAIYSSMTLTIQLLLELGALETLPGNSESYTGTALDCSRNRPAIFKIIEDYVEKKQMQNLIKKVESKNEKEEMLAKALILKKTINLKEQKRAKLLADINAVKANPDFKTDEVIKKLQLEVEEIKQLVAAVLKSLGIVNKPEDNSLCRVCMEAPMQAFICMECEKWVCGNCKDQLENCPHCRADFKQMPLKRSRAVEHMLGLH